MADVIVSTRYGSVTGREEDDLAVFRGIPFAAPPVGQLRFRAPQPPEAWSGSRSAATFAPMSVQPPPTPMDVLPGDPIEQSEDCLYLNIWTEACDAARRPVMVWIHGGGFTGGATSSGLYAGAQLARRKVVVVSVAYRLGALGFAGHPDLADSGDPAAGFANWGLQDQLAALAWVREHIDGFGGDPHNVTIFGESAGGMSVAALLSSPRSSGLFKRAIVESGNPSAVGVGSAVKVTEALARELGISGPLRERLATVPVEDLLAAQQAVSARQVAARLPFQAVVDGGVLASHPAASLAAGASSDVDVIVGTNRDEWRLWTWSNPALREIDAARLESLVTAQIRATGVTDRLDSGQLIDLYRSGRMARGQAVSPSDVYCAIASDWIFRVPSMRMAEAMSGRGGRTYAYLFDWESPYADGVLGSCHALELPFVFGPVRNDLVSLFAGSGEAAEQLSDRMQESWTAFAATGDPSALATGEWPEYESGRRATMRFGPEVGLVEAPMEDERAIVDKALGPFGEIETLGLDRAERARARARP